MDDVGHREPIIDDVPDSTEFGVDRVIAHFCIGMGKDAVPLPLANIKGLPIPRINQPINIHTEFIGHRPARMGDR